MGMSVSASFRRLRKSCWAASEGEDLTLHDVRAGKTKMRQRPDGLVDHNASPGEYFPELDCRLTAPILRQIGIRANVDWVYRGCETRVPRLSRLIRRPV